MALGSIAAQVVRWQREHGRSHLPWQNTRDPYRVWLSEIMLQQTQVSTVLGYYARFLERFPDVQALAAADADAVMGLWSGLGYYSRARNLHRCAQAVVAQHGGQFPRTARALAELPGIGRSTASAIAAFCFQERVPILDANVRRVLTRVLAFDGDLAQAQQERQLWAQAQAMVPDSASDMPAYTQGMMDLGAMVCLPRRPLCDECPLNAQCQAHAAGTPTQYPVRTRKLKRSAQAWWMLWAQDDAGRVWLQRRPPTGIWAGLYCWPVFDSHEALEAAVGPGRALEGLPPALHVLTHRDLHLHPVRMQGPVRGEAAGDGAWFGPHEWPALGLPAPVRLWLEGQVP